MDTKTKNMNFSLWHYLRFVHKATTTSGLDVSGAHPPEDTSRSGVQKHTEAQLQTLSEQFKSNGDAMLQFSQALSTESVMSWNDSGVNKKDVALKLQKALAQIRDSYGDFKAPEGFMEMVTGLKANSKTAQHEKALLSLEAFTNAIDEYSGEMLRTQQGLKEMKGDVITGGIEGFFKTVVNRLDRGSGTEKIAMVGSLAVGLYFLFNNATLAKYAKIGGGALALNYLIGVLTGKTGLEHVGLLTPNGELPQEMQYALEKSGLKDPRHAIGLAKLSGKPMVNLYAAYIDARNHEISAVAFGLHDEEMTNQELYGFIDTLVKGAGGRDQFEKKYIQENTKDMSLLQVIMATSGHDVLSEISKIYPGERQKMTRELRGIFGDRREFQAVDVAEKWEVRLGGFIVNMPQGDTDPASKNHSYRFQLDTGEVILRVNEERNDLNKKLDQLTELVRQSIHKRLQQHGFIQGRTIELDNDGEWIVRDVVVSAVGVIPVVKKDVVVKELKGRGLEYFMDGVRIADTESGDRITIEKSYQKFEMARKIYEKIPFLRGIPLEVQSMTPDTRGGTAYRCSVAGVPFNFSQNAQGGIAYGNADAVALLKNDSFLRAKKDWFDEQMASSDFTSLENIAGELKEDWLALKLFGSLSGSVSENLWKSGFAAKKTSLKALYAASLSGAANLQDAMIAEQNFLSEIRGEAKNIYSDLDNKVLHDEDVSEDTFMRYYRQLITMGVTSAEVRFNIEKVAQRFTEEVNHEGIDGSDLEKLGGWSETHRILLEQYLTFLAPISRKMNLDVRDQEYMKMVENKMFEKILRFKKSSNGILWTDLHESLNADNIGDWGIPKYADYVGGLSAASGTPAEILYTNQAVPAAGMRILDGNFPPLEASDMHFVDRVPDRLNGNNAFGVSRFMGLILGDEYSQARKQVTDTPLNNATLIGIHNLFIDSEKWKDDFNKIFYVNGGPTTAGYRSFPEQVQSLKFYQTEVRTKFTEALKSMGK